MAASTEPQPDTAADNAIVWTPTQAYLERSRLRCFIEREGSGDYEAHVSRAAEDLNWYWDAVVRDLGLEWSTRYDQELDLSAAAPWARWIPGGGFKYVHN